MLGEKVWRKVKRIGRGLVSVKDLFSFLHGLWDQQLGDAGDAVQSQVHLRASPKAAQAAFNFPLFNIF